MASKAPNFSPLRRDTSATALSICATSRLRSSSPITLPSIWNRSLTRNRCGEVNNPVRNPQDRAMEAQNAAVEPLPFDPVITTEWLARRARSMASRSSSSAIRARQTPSPNLGRSNIQQAHRNERVPPNFQDQVVPLRLFEKAD